MQLQREDELRAKRNGRLPITKHDSLNDRARKLGIAMDIPAVNRNQRRTDLKKAIKEESK